MSKGFKDWTMQKLAEKYPEQAQEIFDKGKPTFPHPRQNNAAGAAGQLLDKEYAEKAKVDYCKRMNGEVKIFVKPLSTNHGYTGKRWKTKAHREWHKRVMKSLPEITVPLPPFQVHYVFGLSNSLSDGDNCVKFIQDCIAKKYGFNDKLIKRWVIDIEETEKGKEFLQFKIETL